MLTPKNSGWIEVICGPMFSGKTEELIRRLVRAQYAKQNVAIFKPKTDNRYPSTDERPVTKIISCPAFFNALSFLRAPR